MNFTIGIFFLVGALVFTIAYFAIQNIPLHARLQPSWLHPESVLLKFLKFLPIPLVFISGFILFPFGWRIEGAFLKFGTLYILAGLDIALLHVNISRDPGLYGRGCQFFIILFLWPMAIFKYLNDLRWRIIFRE